MEKVKILRFDPVVDKEPYFQEYTYELSPEMTVLDVLNYIHSELDPGLSYCYCCRNKHCGLCGLTVNGRAVLSCKCPAVPDMEIKPLDGFPVLKDLSVDREYYEKLRGDLRLQLERESGAVEEPEVIDMDAFELFKTASRCIECYCCVASCPVFKKSPHKFIGPAALVLEGRHFFDPRDDLNRELILKSAGIDQCIGCGLCSRACQLNVQPAKLIEKMKASVKNGH